MSKALEYVKEEILKLHQIAELGNTERTAAATGKFLKAMGMDLPESVLTENGSSGSNIVNAMLACQNSVSNVESSGESHLSGAPTKHSTISTEIILLNPRDLKNHFKNPKHQIETSGCGALKNDGYAPLPANPKHQIETLDYGALQNGDHAPLLGEGKNKNSDLPFDLPESIKMGLDCGCPACKFLDKKRENWPNKPDYCCGCCPVYKSHAVKEEELKQDFEALHEPLKTFFDSMSVIGLAQQ